MAKKDKPPPGNNSVKRSKMSELFPVNKILKGVTYFAITTGSNDGENWWSETQTYWVGFADDERRVELRQIRAVYPDKMARYWKDFWQPFSVVNDDQDYVRWMLGGGHALITEAQTREHLPNELKPRPCVIEGSIGFTDLKQLPKSIFTKAPTPKLRMKVLKRDQYRCMICGQRPAEDVNIQLQAHHIRPFAKRGITTEKNLITLCHTCHAGLEPHYEWNLFELLEKKFGHGENELKRRELKEHVESVERYRCMMRNIFVQLDKSDK